MCAWLANWAGRPRLGGHSDDWAISPPSGRRPLPRPPPSRRRRPHQRCAPSASLPLLHALADPRGGGDPNAGALRLRQLPDRAHRTARERQPDAHPEPDRDAEPVGLRLGFRLRLRVGFSEGFRVGEPDAHPELRPSPLRSTPKTGTGQELSWPSRDAIGAALHTEPGWSPVSLQSPAVNQLALPMIGWATWLVVSVRVAAICCHVIPWSSTGLTPLPLTM